MPLQVFPSWTFVFPLSLAWRDRADMGLSPLFHLAMGFSRLFLTMTNHWLFLLVMWLLLVRHLSSIVYFFSLFAIFGSIHRRRLLIKNGQQWRFLWKILKKNNLFSQISRIKLSIDFNSFNTIDFKHVYKNWIIFKLF